MFEYKLPDEEFNLMDLSDEELFNALKKEVVGAIKKFDGFSDIDEKCVLLDGLHSSRRRTYGRYYNLYPHIVLDVGVKRYLGYDGFYLFINTFGVGLSTQGLNPKILVDGDLTRAFVKFMEEQFPNSSYSEKRKKYFEFAKTRNKIEEELLFQ